MPVQDIRRRVRGHMPAPLLSRLPLVGILALAVAVRVYFWRDLGTLSWDGGAHSLGGVLIGRTLLHLFDDPVSYAQTFTANYWATVGSVFFYPYGYDLLTAVSYLVFGFNDFAARLPNMIASILIFHPMYLIAKQTYDERNGHVAALFGALAPVFISWGGRASVDIPMILFMSYAVYLLLRAIDRDGYRYWLLTGLSIGVGGLMKPTALIFGPPLFGMAVYLDRELLFQSEYYIGGVVGLIFPGTYVASGFVAEALFPGIGRTAVGSVMHWFGSAVEYAETGDPSWRTVDAWLYYVQLFPSQLGWVIVGFVLIALSAIFSRRRKTSDEERVLLAAVVFVFLLFVFLPNKDSRYVMPYLPLLCVFGTKGVRIVGDVLRDELAGKIGDRFGGNARFGVALACVLVLGSVVATGLAVSERNSSNYPDAGLGAAAGEITEGPPGIIVPNQQSDSLSVNALSFYVVTNDPNLKYSVSWPAQQSESDWIIAKNRLSSDRLKLQTVVRRDHTLYIYRREPSSEE